VNSSDHAVSVSLSGVVVSYKLYEYRSTSFKEYLLNRLRGRHKSRDLVAVNNVSLEIRKGEAVGLVGHNGSGKSTLLKVIAGVIRPLSGTVMTRGRIAPMIELGAGFDMELSGRENIYLSCTMLGLEYEEIRSLEQRIIDFSEIEPYIDLPVKNYSSGMQARLGFACSTAVTPDILIVDEVLSVGDSNFASKCLARIVELRESGTTIVLVSHDPGTIRAFCSRAVVMNQGLMLFDGPCADAMRFHEEIMRKRYLESLSEAERKEIERREKLHGAGAANTESTLNQLPEAVAQVSVKQRGVVANRIDSSQDFEIVVNLKFENSLFLKGKVNVGFGIMSHDNRRISGLNVGQMNELIESSAIKEDQSVTVTFSARGGIPVLGSGIYRIVAGALDDNDTRSLIKVSSDCQVEFCRGSDTFNPDRDIIAHGFLKDLTNLSVSLK
jgi:ABC-2 type transport system ATP-binding protein